MRRIQKDVYIYIYQRFKRVQIYNPMDPFYTKESLIYMFIYKKVYLYKMSERKKTHQASKKIQTAAQHTRNRQYVLLNLRRGKERVMSNFITQ